MTVNQDETYQRLGNMHGILKWAEQFDWLEQMGCTGAADAVSVDELRKLIRSGAFDVSKDAIKHNDDIHLVDLNFLLNWLRGFGIDGEVRTQALRDIAQDGEFDVMESEIQ